MFTTQTYDEVAIYPFASAGYVDTIKSADIITKVLGMMLRLMGLLATVQTDDTTFIQAALDAANTASGGAVYVPDGIYMITASLTIGDNTVLYGNGRRSLIRAEASLNDDMFINKDTVGGNVYIEVRDIAFDGDRTNQTTGGILHFDNVDRFNIHDCWFLNAFNDAVFIDNSFWGRIANNHAENAGADSFTVHNTFDLIIIGNVSYSAGATGTGGGGITIIDVDGRIIIDGNQSIGASGTNGNGIVLQDCSNSIVSNNISSGNATHGIETDTGNGRHTIIGNQSIIMAIGVFMYLMQSVQLLGISLQVILKVA